MNIDVDCPISHQEEENINYLFRSCALAYTIWSIININALVLIIQIVVLYIGLNIFGLGRFGAMNFL